MNYNIYLFSIGSFLFIGFAIHLLFTKYGNQYLNKLFGIIMIGRGFQMLYYIFVTTGQTFFVSCLFKTLNPLFFAIPSCVYLYVRGFIKDESQMQSKDWLHFIPVLLAIIDIIPWYFLEASTREVFISKIIDNKLFFINDNFSIIPNIINVLLRSVLLTVYLFFCWRIVLQSKIIKERKSNLIATNWILVILSTFTLVNINFLSTTVFNLVLGEEYANRIYDNYNFPLFGIVIVVIIAFVFYNPTILYGYVLSKDFTLIEKKQNLISVAIIQDVDSIKENVKKKTFKNISSSVLVQNEQLFMNEIIAFMKTKKPYLNPDFTISILSQETNIPVHHCSYILNYIIKKNFRDWVNGYRIAHFIEQYPVHSKTKTILGLSIESGFKNKVTFYNSFMKEKGVLPTDYFRD